MASIVLRIDERIIKNGMAPVRVRISHNNSTAWHPTGVSVEPKCFQAASIYEPLNRRAYMYEYKREQLAAIVRRWDEGLFELQRAEGGEAQLADMSAKELRDHIFGKKVKRIKAAELVRKRKIDASDSFMDWFDKYGQERNSERTREHFAYVWRLLYKYMRARDKQHLTFGDITYEFLVDLKAWLRNSRKGEATRFKVESYVRAAYREGVRCGKCARENDPFFDYRIEKVPEKDIETISRENMRVLMKSAYPTRPGLQRARDMLLASFYLCGANFIDMYEMNTPVNGEVMYVRHKVQRRTQKAVKIRVEPELSEIIEKYSGHDRLFDFTAGFRSLQYRLGDNYQSLSAALGFKVSMELIRRTWATLAGEIECPEIVIDKSMGHITRSVTGKYYEQYDWSRTARWNRRVIDYVKGNYEN